MREVKTIARRAWGTGPPITNNGKALRLRYRSGVVILAQVNQGAIEVARGVAVIVTGRGKHGQPIPETRVVLCRRKLVARDTSVRLPSGVPLNVVNPGKKHSFYVPTRRTTSLSILPKNLCRNVGGCADAGEDCGNCCNNHNE